MDYKDLAIKIWILLMIGIALSLAVCIISPPSDALEIHQGDVVYIGETVDISMALAWPAYTIAWCKGSGYGCLPPDQVIQVTGFMHNYYIDPNVFHTGTYYRWDGYWNRGENMKAFTVSMGTRPEPTPTPSVKPTPSPDENEGLDENGNGPFTFLIARGDDPALIMKYASDYFEDDGHLWLFGTSNMIIDKSLIQNGDFYTYPFEQKESASLATGEYKGYLQFDGKNEYQDLYYNPSEKILDSPYDQARVPHVKISELDLRNPLNILEMFRQASTGMKYGDDHIVPIKVTVEEPKVVVTDVIQDSGDIWVAGTTTWSEDSIITVKLDPENYKKPQDIRSHTWTTNAYGKITGMRKFAIDIPIDYTEMALGDHELELSVTKNNYTSKMIHNFKVSGLYITPTPTPYIEKFLNNSDGSPMTTRTPVPTNTPVPTLNASVVTEIVNVTPISTRVMVTDTTKPIPTPTHDRNITVPLPWWIAFVAIGFAYWRLK